MPKWTSTRDFATRRANLNGVGSGPRNNSIYFLCSTAAYGIAAWVLDDGIADVLTGSSAEEFDWFLFVSGDHATDLTDSAFANDLDCIDG